MQAPPPAPTATSTAKTRALCRCCSTHPWSTTAFVVRWLPPAWVSNAVLDLVRLAQVASCGTPACLVTPFAAAPRRACVVRADCCDGSDEPAGRCQDTCQQQGWEVLASLRHEVGVGVGAGEGEDGLSCRRRRCTAPSAAAGLPSWIHTRGVLVSVHWPRPHLTLPCPAPPCHPPLQAAAAEKGVAARQKFIDEASGAKARWAQRKGELDAQVEALKKDKEDAEGGWVGGRASERAQLGWLAGCLADCMNAVCVACTWCVCACCIRHIGLRPPRCCTPSDGPAACFSLLQPSAPSWRRRSAS